MTIISSDTETSGDTFDFSTSDQLLIVKYGVSLVSDDGNTVYAGSNLSQNSVLNHGDIQGLYGVDFNETYGSIVNFASATISANGGQAVAFEYGHGSLLNQGDIVGADTGVYDGGGSVSIDNEGSISTTTDPSVELSGAGEKVVNSGEIRSTSKAIVLDPGATAAIQNSDVIQASLYSVDASQGGAVTIKNTGTLDGDILLGNAVNRITNLGAILGDVSLGDAGSVFDGHGGTVSGTIMGGAGADKIMAGNDGETLAGGKGHDNLYGGAGADTFAFSSFAAADTDTIHSFDVASDTIQLDHAVFTHLQSDATPAFSIGTSASSATDFLFYNSGSGVLFYDPDGSGTAHAANAVATLAPGLKLTASNFSVV